MIGWPVGSDPLPLLQGCVQVWVVALDEASFDRRSWLYRLSPEEQARAQRFKFAADQRRYIIAHIALRDILARYLNVAAGDLRFVDGENGKPRLAEALGSRGIEFNLSHSHERALIAVTCELVVGIDIEFVKSQFGFHEVAERFFTRREVSALRALPPMLQRQAFYKCWTSKEAFLKAKGTGLSGALDEVEIVSAYQDRVAIHASVPGWWLTELDPGDDYEGALVIEGEQAVPIHRHRWQPAG
jgi:4'-phosphopantetheinyl transferase